MMSLWRRALVGVIREQSYSPGSPGSGSDQPSVSHSEERLNQKWNLMNLHADLMRRIAPLPRDFPNQVCVSRRVKNKAGQELDTLVLTGLDKVEEPESLHLLRHRVARRQPLVDLPELLLEIQARTGFASEFSHISEARSRLDDLPTSICAVLIAEACNIGLTPMIRKGIPALERDRLLYVQQNYIRPDTLSRANARLVDYQAHNSSRQRHGAVGKSQVPMDYALSFL